jgi:hypothetical protein
MGELMNFIELDHTSSGVQVAAALARDSRTATAVNLNGGSSKNDLYTVVMSDANARLAALGSKIVLTRRDVKTAVIARVYGGKRGTSDAAFAAATGLKLTPETKPMFACLNDAIVSEMSGVVTVQRYVARLLKMIAESGSDSVTLTLASGAVETFRFPDAEKTVHDVNLHFGGEHGRVDELPYLTGELDVGAAARTVVAAFVQSFDALILAMTQVRLAERGVYFLSKHDAYLIAESDGDVLREIVKNVMFDVFSVDRLETMRAELSDRYGLDLPRFDGYGDWDVAAILKSDFLISE